MTQQTKNRSSALAGSTGAQGSFLEECGVFVLPQPSGALGSAGAQPAASPSRAPEHSHGDREHNSSGNSGERPLHSRTPAESDEKKTGLVNQWHGDARRVINELPDQSVRNALMEFYDEAAGALQRQGKSLDDAHQEAFGLLLFCILKSGVEIPVINTRT